MHIQRRCVRALLVMLCVSCVAFNMEPLASGQGKDKEKEKNSIKSLFDGIPVGLRAKVKENPVRCDRVNDWLQENVNGKGKTIEVQVEVKQVKPYRAKDGTYSVDLTLAFAEAKLLETEWQVFLGDRKREPGYSPINFVFEGVSAADAEKLADAKHVTLQGKLQEVALPRFSYAKPVWGAINVVLEDVHVDGKKWKKSSNKKGGGFGTGGQ
jgi:hypothetical protein